LLNVNAYSRAQKLHVNVKLLEFEVQAKSHLICLPGNMQVSYFASEGQY